VIGNYQQRPRQAVIEILDMLRLRGLALDDLIHIGGEDLESSNPKRVEKARHVEKCWALMARLSVKFTDLEVAAPCTPGEVKSLKTNNKTDHHSVEVSGKGRWKHKRRLVVA
jgi:hypothetical protein